MKTLLRTEWLKMRKYNAFWWIMGITMLSYPGVNYIAYFAYKEKSQGNAAESAVVGMLGNPFNFPEVWHTVAFFSSVFVFIPAVMIIMLICNEYTFRTHRQHIIDGWSRKQFVTSKLFDVLIISFIITVLYALVAFFIGMAAHDRLIRDTWGQTRYIFLFGLQTFAQLSIAFLIGFLVRKAFLALGIFLFYFIVLENIAVGILTNYNSPVAHYLPLQISDRMIPAPAFWGRLDPENYTRSLNAVNLHIVLTLILTSLIWLICYRINSKRDLK